MSRHLASRLILRQGCIVFCTCGLAFFERHRLELEGRYQDVAGIRHETDEERTRASEIADQMWNAHARAVMDGNG